uniref:Major facilitator superfamily (MFS) profile domain-containing protein n=1 Tax=Bombyx mori TaxID=7091 RepID=A0A8R2HPP7_BOMMO|nr:facilitated trehalose transporter Tret1-2 homolog [Bombyx mori]
MVNVVDADKSKVETKGPIENEPQILIVKDENQRTRGYVQKNFNYKKNLDKSSSTGLGLTGGNGVSKGVDLLSDSKTVPRFSPIWKQSLAASAPILLGFAAGSTFGFSAILLPQLREQGGPIPADEETASWIASIATLPVAPACLISGWIFERFGRRPALFITCAPFLLGWALIIKANNLTLMLCGRFFTGMCTGLIGPLASVYIGETTEPKYRGLFLAAISLAMASGMFFSHIIGTFISWQWTAVICALLPILSLVLLVFVPESPTWLISRGHIEEGAKVFYWLRGYSDEAKDELKDIIDRKLANDDAPVETWKDKIRYYKCPEFIKPLVIMIFFFSMSQFAGANAVAFYSVEIIKKALGKDIDQYMAMLLIDFLRLLASVAACIICKQYGRRPVCFVSGGLTTISMAGLSIFLYLRPENMAWIPLSCFMLYICAISIGLVPLPWMMCGEIFPTKVRGLGSGVSSAVGLVSVFVVVKTAPGMMSHLGQVFTFSFYGAIAFIGSIILFFVLPETKGRSLQEIEDKFKNQKSNGSKF